MRSCYDNLLSVAAAIANSAYGNFLVQSPHPNPRVTLLKFFPFSYICPMIFYGNISYWLCFLLCLLLRFAHCFLNINSHRLSKDHAEHIRICFS